MIQKKVTKVTEVTQVTKARGQKTAHASARFLPVSLLSLVSPFFCSAASAAEQKLFAAPQAAAGTPASTAGGLAQVTLSLALVLAAVFAAAWAMRKMRNVGRADAGVLKVLADVSVGAKERVVLVKVHEQQVLIGVAAGNVNVLHVLPAGTPTSTSTASSVVDVTPNEPGKVDFKAILKRSLGMK